MVCTIAENAITTLDPSEYDSRYKELEKRYQQEEQERQAINYQIADLTTRPAQASLVRDCLAAQPPLEYSDEAWNILVEQAIIDTEGSISISFKDHAWSAS